jgi:hypothetical protein
MSDRDYYSPWNTHDRIMRARRDRQRDLEHKIIVDRLVDDMKTGDALRKSLESSATPEPPAPPPPRVNEELVGQRAALIKLITDDQDHAFLLYGKTWAAELEAIDLSQPGAWRKLRHLARQVAQNDLGISYWYSLGTDMRWSMSLLGGPEKPTVPLVRLQLVVGLWELQDACREHESRT